jgi:hypothetical protein
LEQAYNAFFNLGDAPQPPLVLLRILLVILYIIGQFFGTARFFIYGIIFASPKILLQKSRQIIIFADSWFGNIY